MLPLRHAAATAGAGAQRYMESFAAMPAQLSSRQFSPLLRASCRHMPFAIDGLFAERFASYFHSRLAAAYC